MTLWFAALPVFLLAATGAAMLVRRWRNPAFKILGALNIAVMAGSLALLAGAWSAGPAAASGRAAPALAAAAAETPAGAGGSVTWATTSW